MSENDYDTITVQRSKVLKRPDGRAAILLEGTRRGPDKFAVAFEVTVDTIRLLRAELDRAEAFLQQQIGRA